MIRCVFDNGDSCKALTERKCNGCKFRKTQEQYDLGIQSAKLKLIRKGLKAVQKRKDGVQVMTVTKIEID